MKKSEMYRVAQVAILDDKSLSISERLETLKELMAAESVAKYSEEKEAEQEEEF